ncbi:lytic transglycosylase domain-containing protein [Phenylobacterium sp.]|uniref:lytic transglycosylase domain-containing protein n=1 Tax=Phenylobacterium sp. TaxID=1871053 RepID=UPI00396303BD
MLDPQAVMALSAQCAPGVAPSTLLALARAESGLNPLAIGVNGPRSARPRPSNRAGAVAAAKVLVAAGRDIDLGLLQINVRNLPRLRLSLEDAFDPCRNLAAAAQVLREGYARGLERHGAGQPALRVALSFYNTGHAQRGFADGYVARVLAHADHAPQRPALADREAPGSPGPASLSAPAWDVFGRAAGLRTGFVTSPSGATP